MEIVERRWPDDFRGFSIGTGQVEKPQKPEPEPIISAPEDNVGNLPGGPPPLPGMEGKR